MKLNWGKSLVLAMVLFISFIMYMVVTMLSDKGYNHEMVVEEYYKEELTLNEKIESRNNGKNIENFVSFKANTKGVLISLTDELQNLKNVEFKGYRASNKSKDFSTKLQFNTNNEALVKRDLLPGFWEFNLHFVKDGKTFLVTKNINI